MKAVLISVQPPHTTNMFNKIKRIEWRTKPMPTGKHYVYETKNGGGIGMVIGECLIWRIRRYENVSFIPEGHIDAGCVPYEFLAEYSKGKPLYAHFIINANRYDKPKPLSDFYIVDNEEVKKCEHRERVYCNPDLTNGAWLPGGYVCSKDEIDWCSKCKTKPVVRPPQSWCHVEDLE